jgi:hypothetical protein
MALHFVTINMFHAACTVLCPPYGRGSTLNGLKVLSLVHVKYFTHHITGSTLTLIRVARGVYDFQNYEQV